MLSVGIFTYSTRPRGSVVHAANLAEALTASGHAATLYALGKTGDRFYRELSCPLVLLAAAEAPSDPDALIAQRIGEFVQGLRRLGVGHDIYHAQDCLAASALLALRSEQHLGPVVRTVHHVERFASRYLAGCQRRSIEGADGLVSVSALTQREVLATFARQSTLIHNGVDVERFAVAAPNETELVANLGVAENDLLVLSVGGVEPRKNMHACLAAIAAAARDQSRLRWVIVGGASIWEHQAYRDEFAAQLARLAPELRTRISCLPPVDEATLLALYRRSDVLLSPSTQEGWGLCVLEALAAGTAVVASDRAPFTEYLDASAARLVDPDSPAAIAAGLIELLRDPALRTSLAREGLGRARQFSWARAARLHAREYQAVRSNYAHVRPSAAVSHHLESDHA